MTAFFERLEARARDIDSLLCVGLDPHAADLPETSADATRDFCLRLIEQTHNAALAYKPNIAFFEVYGAEGIAALKAVIEAVPEGIPVVLDAKRGDIGSTSEAYARAVFETLGADCVTINPYLGFDSVAPFLKDEERGVFLLAKTSNPSAADVQDRFSDGQPVYVHVAQLAKTWNTRGNLGLVVGATFPEVLLELRALASELWFLTPGVGAQGADLNAALNAGLRTDGLGMLIPVSRGISRAGDPAAAAEDYRRQFNAVRASRRTQPASINNRQLADDLLSLECVKFGDFTLKSGAQSPIYIDLRRLVGDPQVLARAAAAHARLLHPLTFDRLAGLPYAALPIATAVSLQGGWPLIYPRKEIKEYGTGAAIEGPFEAGETAVVLDDLVSTGESKFEGIEKLTAAGLKVSDVVVLIDRDAGAGDLLASRGVQLHAVFQLLDLLDYWHAISAINSDQRTAVLNFLGK